MNRNDCLVEVPFYNRTQCNMCGSDLKHYIFCDTYIWCCEDCANIQFEYNTNYNLRCLEEFLTLETKEKEDIENDRSI